MKPLVTMREALADPALFGTVLGGESWLGWRALLIAMMGEPLTVEERAVFKSLTGRDSEPLERVEEFWGVIGRRGGKSRSMGVLAAYIAGLCDHSASLTLGERGVIPVLAATQKQAAVLFGYIDALFDRIGMLAELVENRTADTLTLTNGVDIEVKAANYRTVRSITAVAAIGDEVAFWLIEGSANPDTEILNALRPALATTGGPLIVISSPYARKGEVYTTYRQHYGPDGDPLILVAHGASRDLNPSLAQKVVDRAMERDAAAASAEYGAQFRTDVEAYISREVVEAAVAPGRHELPPLPGVTYKAFVDAAGGSGTDSFTLAIAHRDSDGRAILDALRDRRPPFSPKAVVEEYAELLKLYRISSATADRWGGQFPVEAFKAHGITLQVSDRSKSDLYRDALPLLNSGKVELLDNGRMVAQLCSLERRTARGGKDSIDHPPHKGANDDSANAVAGVICITGAGPQPLVITEDMLAWSRRPSLLIARQRAGLL